MTGNDRALKLPPGFAAELIAWRVLGEGASFLGANNPGFDLLDWDKKQVEVKSGHLLLRRSNDPARVVDRIRIFVSLDTLFGKVGEPATPDRYLMIVSTSHVTPTVKMPEVTVDAEGTVRLGLEVDYPSLRIFKVTREQRSCFSPVGDDAKKRNVTIPLADCSEQFVG